MKAPKLYDNMSFQPQKSKSGYVAEPNMIMREWCAEVAQAKFEEWWAEYVKSPYVFAKSSDTVRHIQNQKTTMETKGVANKSVG